MRVLSLLAWLAVPSVVTAGTGAIPPERVRAEFQTLCRALTEGPNDYFGSLTVTRLEEGLRQLGQDPSGAVRLRLRLAHELIRVGRLSDAVEHLQESLALVESGGVTDDGGLAMQIFWYLGIAHLNLAEDENCVLRHSARSCILPITADAVHTLPAHSRAAGDSFLRYLERDPDDVQARWLLNLARMISGDHPAGVPPRFLLPPDALTSEAPFPEWRDIAPELGVDSFDLSGGALMDDFDGDGLLDLVSSSWDPCEPVKAFRNDGRGGMAPVDDAWGLDVQLGGLNMVQTDFDNDGMVDILILRGAWLGTDGQMRNSLLRNELDQPEGRFVDVTAAAGMAFPAYPSQAASWADFDLDGDLDLYIGNEATGSSTDPLQLFGEGGNPYPSQLFRNNGDGTFTDIARAAGVENRRYAKGVAWGDFDDDGDPDLYVSNLGPNRLYRNLGDGTFRDDAEALAVVEPAKGSFPTWFFDFDNDGDLDLFVGGYNAPAARVSRSYFGDRDPTGHCYLYRNDGGRFTDVSVEVGLWRPLLVMGANYGDLDADGYPDLYLGTGVPAYEALMPNVMYHNEGGERFRDVTFAGGFGHLQKGHGVAFGDLDNDGAQEIWEQMGGAFPYDRYGNVLYDGPEGGGHWITLRLEGRAANRAGVGARIAVRVRESDGPRTVHVLAGSGGSFGGSSLQQEIGLGRAEAIERIEISWPGSRQPQRFDGAELDRFYRAVQGEPELITIDLPRLRLGGSVAETHHDPGAGGGSRREP